MRFVTEIKWFSQRYMMMQILVIFAELVGRDCY